MKVWQRDLGIWQLLQTKWLSVHGTTPRNADVWSLDIDTPKYSVWFSTGLHKAVYVWNGNKITWFLERYDPDCKCYSCGVKMRSLTDDEIRILSEAFNDPNRPTRKLPPRDFDGSRSD